MPAFLRSILPPVSNKATSDISNVKKVISELPSVPLKMISVSPPCASIVILPEEVVKCNSTSPVVKSSAALDTVSKDSPPEPSVFRNCPEEPSVVNVNVKDDDILPAFKPT